MYYYDLVVLDFWKGFQEYKISPLPVGAIFPSEGTFTIFVAVISLILSRGVSYRDSRSHLKKRPKKITVRALEGKVNTMFVLHFKLWLS